MKLNFNWEENKAQYQTGESLYVNRIRLARYGWNGSRSKSDPREDNDWVGRVTLPSLKTEALFGETQESIRATIERVVHSWFVEALKK